MVKGCEKAQLAKCTLMPLPLKLVICVLNQIIDTDSVSQCLSHLVSKQCLGLGCVFSRIRLKKSLHLKKQRLYMPSGMVKSQF